MKFGYTIVYVENVKESLAFFERAFGLKTSFLDEAAGYGELDTGATALAFASHTLMAELLPGGYVSGQESARPLGTEIGLFVDDVAAAHQQALACGAVELAAPKRTPWGQLVAFVRCPDGTLVEICTPTQR